MKLSLVKRILLLGKPYVLFHTHVASREIIERAIRKNKSMDLDISVDSTGNPYLGHSQEYYEISGEKKGNSISYFLALELLAKSKIPVIIDCKNHAAWHYVKMAVMKLGDWRCVVNSFVTELKYSHVDSGVDYLAEWVSIDRLREIKEMFPLVTTSASCKFLPKDIFTNGFPTEEVYYLRENLMLNTVDTVSFNVPNETISNSVLQYFLEKGIISHLNVDLADTSLLSSVYMGETDNIKRASDSSILNMIE
ncbi:MAG: hypothetical protein AAB893_01755 [Patescibacteria group bacterium]